MEPIADLKLIKPVRAGYEIGYRAGLLILQVAVAIHGLLLGVVKGQVKASDVKKTVFLCWVEKNRYFSEFFQYFYNFLYYLYLRVTC